MDLQLLVKQLRKISEFLFDGGHYDNSTQVALAADAIQDMIDDAQFYDYKEGDLNENTMKITKEQLQQIIKEGVEKLHRKTLIENRLKEVVNELSFLGKDSDEDNGTTLDLKNMKVGEAIKLNSPEELAPFNLKLTNSGQAYSDLPELSGMVFKYENNSLTRIK